MRAVGVVGLMLSLAGGLQGGTALSPECRVRLGPYLQPPPEWAARPSGYEAPLKFRDGAPVRSAADWNRKRASIREAWHEIMGAWPPRLERPRWKVLREDVWQGLIQRSVQVQVAPDRDQEAILLVPPGTGPFPAVLVPFYDAETSVGRGKPMRDYALQLARRGFVTLSIGSPGGDAWKPEIGEATCQPLSYLAYVAANCGQALARLPEVDAKRLGIVGHSYGGKWALFAACLNDQFACGVWSDPGVAFDEDRPSVNYWDPHYLGNTPPPRRKRGLPSGEHPRTGAYRVLRERGHDLPELLTLMSPRPFLVSGGSEDTAKRWLALRPAMEVNRMLGHEDRVAMTNREGHSPTAASNEVILTFFECWLKPVR